ARALRLDGPVARKVRRWQGDRRHVDADRSDEDRGCTGAARLSEYEGIRGLPHPCAQARGLCIGAHGAGVGRVVDGTYGGARRESTVQRCSGGVGDEPAVPQSAGWRRNRGRCTMNRRHFLRGAGVALALPWMESLGKAAAASDPGKAPLRFACIYWSNGIKPANWWAKGEGASMELGPSAAPLSAIREDMVFVRGLYNHQAFVNPSPHMGRMANMLSGAPVSPDPAVIKVGTTFDQVLAREIGARTQVPSLALGIEPNELRLEDGLSMIYGSNISWVSPTRPATKEIYPARTFDQLVGDGKGRRLDKSLLDAVMEDAHSLQPKVSSGDRKKLDENLESVRDIEKRIDRAAKQERLDSWRPTR